MTPIKTFFLAALCAISANAATAQALIDKGFVSGWNVMVDPAFGNGCLIQTVYEDGSVLRIGYDALKNRGYFVAFNKAWGDIEDGANYDIRFDLDGEEFNATATGFYLDRVPGAGVFFQDRAFIHAIAAKKGMTIYNTEGQAVMAVDLKGSAKALDYARKCQDEQG